MIKEYVSKKGLAVVKVCIDVELHCKCGKISKVNQTFDTVHSYYNSVGVFAEVKCPHCGEEYECQEY